MCVCECVSEFTGVNCFSVFAVSDCVYMALRVGSIMSKNFRPTLVLDVIAGKKGRGVIRLKLKMNI